MKTNKKLDFTIGSEISLVHKDYINQDYGRYERRHVRAKRLTQAWATILNEHLGRDDAAIVDVHCLEVRSPVYRSIDDLVKFYRKVVAFGRRHGFRPHHPRTVCGGGHIHVGIWEAERVASVFKYFWEHPEIAWVFLHPDDTESANNFATSENDVKVLSAQNIAGIEPYTIASHTMNVFAVAGDVNKEFVLSRNNYGKTLEYRCVEAPLNEDEFVAQLKFFVRLTEKIAFPTRHAYWPQITPLDIDQQTAIDSFRRICDDLSLSYLDYEPFVTRNLIPRWQDGRKRT